MESPPPLPDKESPTCVSCGAALTGRWCGQCGEKVIAPHDRSLAHFFEHSLEAFTHFDFKIFRTLKQLLFQPGRLTKDYVEGRRRGQVPPVQLFILANIFFVFCMHLMHASPLSTPLAVQTSNPPMREFKRQMVEREQARSGQTAEQFEREFDRTADITAKTLVVVFMPAFALALAVLYGFRRYFHDTLVFCTHYVSFLLLWMIVVLILWGLLSLLVFSVFDVPYRSSLNQALSLYVTLPGVLVYPYLALRRVFADSWWAAALRTIAMLLVFLYGVYWYRVLLFFATLWVM